MSMRSIASFLGVCLCAVPVTAAGPGTTSDEFLRVAVGPRPEAMGEAYTAAANDILSLYWNPAGLAALPTQQLFLMHNFWLAQIGTETLAFAQPLASGAAVGAGVSALTSPGSARTDSQGTLLGGGDVSSLGAAFTFTYADRWRWGDVSPSQRLWWGASLKILGEQVAGNRGSTAGLDLGLRYEVPGWVVRGLTLAVAAQNLGPSQHLAGAASSLPATLRAGVFWPAWMNGEHAIALSVDGGQSLGLRFRASAGAEYAFREMIFARLGYKITGYDVEDVTAGGGLRLPAGGYLWQLDYSFSPSVVLGSSHRISLSVAFAPPQRELRERRPVRLPSAAKTVPPVTPVVRAPTPQPELRRPAAVAPAPTATPDLAMKQEAEAIATAAAQAMLLKAAPAPQPTPAPSVGDAALRQQAEAMATAAAEAYQRMAGPQPTEAAPIAPRSFESPDLSLRREADAMATAVTAAMHQTGPRPAGGATPVAPGSASERQRAEAMATAAAELVSQVHANGKKASIPAGAPQPNPSSAAPKPGATIPPWKPTKVAFEAIDGGVRLTWKAPEGKRPSGYQVYVSVIAGASKDGRTPLFKKPVTATSCKVEGMKSGITVYVAVAAVDSAGHEGPLSEEIQVKP